MACRSAASWILLLACFQPSVGYALLITSCKNVPSQPNHILESSSAQGLQSGHRHRTGATSLAGLSRRAVLLALPSFVAGAGALGKSAAAFSDEFDVVFDGASVGLQLTGLKYKGSSRVAIGRVVEGSPAAQDPRLRPGLILVSANGRPLEAASARQAADAIRTGARPLTLRFRDASLFNESLEAAAAGDGEGLKQGVSTRVVQAADPRDDQSLAVRTMRRADACRACAGAARGDLLEIRYTARLAATGAVFDASGRGAPGRGGDATFYFVLGEQPRGQFPPGWDLGLLGMCVGEVREVAVPPALGYGARGAPRRGVPGGAALVYEVELVSVNSVALCNAE